MSIAPGYNPIRELAKLGAPCRALAEKNAASVTLSHWSLGNGAVRGAAHEHGSGHDRPSRGLVEGAERAIAGEDAEVGATCLDRLAGGADEAAPVAAPAHGLVRDDRAQPARGVAPARVLDLLREDVERGEHAAAGDEGHRHRWQLGIVPW